MTIEIRKLTEDDVPALQKAIAADTFHPGEWKVEDFLPSPGHAPVAADVIEDQQGSIAFVRYTKSLRISCVWNDGLDNARNARAIIQGIHNAVLKARASGFSELIIESTSEKLCRFLTRILGFSSHGREMVLPL